MKADMYFDTRTQQIAEVLMLHRPAALQVSGTTCVCGYWTEDERPGITRPRGFMGLQWHQAQEVVKFLKGIDNGL